MEGLPGCNRLSPEGAGWIVNEESGPTKAGRAMVGTEETQNNNYDGGKRKGGGHLPTRVQQAISIIFRYEEGLIKGLFQNSCPSVTSTRHTQERGLKRTKAKSVALELLLRIENGV